MSPEAGSGVNKNDIIILTISTKEQTIMVPNLVLMDFAQAEQLLIAQNIGYEVSYITVNYSIQKNSVVSQFPEPGDTISVSEKVICFCGTVEKAVQVLFIYYIEASHNFKLFGPFSLKINSRHAAVSFNCAQ